MKSFNVTMIERVFDDFKTYIKLDNTLEKSNPGKLGSTSADAYPLCVDESPPPVPVTSVSQKKGERKSTIELLQVSYPPSLNFEPLIKKDHLPKENSHMERVSHPLSVNERVTSELFGDMIPEENGADGHKETEEATVEQHDDQEPDSFNPSPSSIINASVHRASELFGLGDEDILTPEAIAVNPDTRDSDIPCASVVVPVKNSLSLTVRGWKVPTSVLGLICIIIAASFIALTIRASKAESLRSAQNQTQMEAFIEDSIERHVFRRNATFSDMDHRDPRFLALDWISKSDTMHLNVSASNLYQRYILAVLAFHFNSLEWTNCGNYIHSETCYVSDQNDTEAENEAYVWLTGTDECGWYGVTCDDNSEVIELEVAKNNWIGEIPPEVSGLRYLQRLILHDNCLYGTLPPELGSLSRLQELNLSVNRLTGYINDAFYNLSSLIRIDLSSQGNNKADDNVYRSCRLRNGAVGNPNYRDDNLGLEGAVLENVWRLEGLKEIKLNDNYFSGTIPPEIRNLNQLEILSVGSNAFSGTIPSDISKMSFLREMWLELNWFMGSIPQNIGEATSLETISFYLIGNLTGTLPDSLYKLGNLKDIYLFGNAFEGSIKSEIGNLKHLTHFSISGNQFTGTLPSELGLCEQLEYVQIDNTLIEGAVPKEVCALKLKHLNSEDPETVEYLKADCLAKNDAFQPFIYCECCSTCCEHATNM